MQNHTSHTARLLRRALTFFAIAFGLLAPVRAQVANWTPLGPAPATGGQVEGIANQPVVGAVHAVLAHPTNPDVLYVGSVNGGVWKTTNATSSSPTWTPLTDSMPSQSIGALTFDLADATFNTLYAGIGRFSSFAQMGSARTGLIRSTDGGQSWQVVNGGGTLTGKNISGIYANGTTVVVSVNVANSFTFGNIGIFRSTDGGTSFSQVSNGNGTAAGLPGGVTHDLVSDPVTPATLYTATVFSDLVGGVNGVYKSTNAGANWVRVSTPAMGALITNNTSNLELSVGRSNEVYAAFINAGALAGLFRSPDGGATWAQMDTPVTNENGTNVGLNPGGQGSLHFSIVADPANANLVYVGGDRQPRSNGDTGSFPNSIGASDFTGRLFRGDASKPAGSQFAHLTHSNALGAVGGGTAGNSAPRANSRDMAFDANGNLIEVDDGGVYRRTSPRTNTGDWFSVIGNLSVAEVHDAAWDSLSNVAITGNENAGTTYQPSESATQWVTLSTGHGGDVAVDNIHLSGSNQSVRYTSFQNLGGLRRTVWDATGGLVSSSFPARTVTGGGAAFSPAYRTPIETNSVAGNRLLMQGSNGLYESLDGGATLTAIGVGRGNTDVAANAISYGGMQNNVANPDLVWAASGSAVVVRTSGTGNVVATAVQPTAAAIRDLAVNSRDWANAFVIDDNQVFQTTNVGASWSDVTGNLMSLAGELRSIAFIPGSSTSAIVVGTNAGVFSSSLASLGTWVRLGTGLPNVLVYDLVYKATDDVLIVGTLGRGAWLFSNAQSILPSPEIAVSGNSIDIANGDAIANTTDDTDFGSAVAAGDTVVRTFTITNSGTAALTISAITAGGDFAIGGIALPASVPAAGSITFTVTFDPSTAGLRTATVNIDNDDASEAPFTFTVGGTGLNSAPTDLALSSATLVENVAANTIVGTLSTTDPDSGDTHTYNFATGTGDTDNGSFTLVGNALKLTASPDYETKSSYTVRIRATDNGPGNLTFEKNFTITIADVDETPSVVAWDDFLRPQDSGGGWTGNWSSAPTFAQGLSYPGMNYGGYAAGPTAAYRSVPAQTTGVVYLSALVRGTGYCNVTLFNGGQERVGFGGIWTGTGPTTLYGTFDATNGALPRLYSSVPVDATTRLLLVRLDLDANTASVWIDPNLSVPLGAPLYTTTSGPATYDFNLVRIEISNTAAIDELRVVRWNQDLLETQTTSPAVSAPVAFGVADTSASLRATVAGGGLPITQVGVVYAPTSVDADPNPGDPGVLQVSGSAFPLGIAGLSQGVSYSFKAYATNSIGTTFTNAGTFTTAIPAVIAWDDFLRPQDSGGGWSGNWTGAVAGIGTNLAYPGLNSGGYAAAGPVGFPGALRDLPPQTTGVVYLSALVSGTSYANVTLYSGGGVELIGFGIVWSGTGPAAQYGTYDNTRGVRSYSTVNVDGGSHLVVVRVDLDANTLSGWVDPDLAAPLGAPAFSSSTNFATGYDFTKLRLELGPGSQIDELRVVRANPELLETQVTSPAISGQSVAAVSYTTVTLGANVTQDGALEISERGIVISQTATNGNPIAGGLGVTTIPTTGTTGIYTLGVTGLVQGATYSFKGYATNSIGTTYTGVGTFTARANVAPTNITLSNASIAENNAPGATIGTLTATDADEGDTHTFSFAGLRGSPVSGGVIANAISANDNAAFIISGNTLRIRDSANFEVKSSYTVRIRATDSARAFFEKDFIITISDVTLPQTITFGPLANKTFGDAPFTVGATGGESGEPVTFTASGAATVAGDLVTITGVGSVTITAHQAGAGDYSAASDVEQSFTVAKAPQFITFNPPATALPTDTLTLSAGGGGTENTVTFMVVSGPGSIFDGVFLNFSGEGTVVVRASQEGNAYYLAAEDVERTITVGSVAPVTTGNTYSGLLADSTGKVRGSFLARLGRTGFGSIVVWVDGRRGGIKVLGETTLSVGIGGVPMTVNFPAGPMAESGNPTRLVSVNTGSETLEGTATRSPYELRKRTLNAGKYTLAASSKADAVSTDPKVGGVMSGVITQFGGVRITVRLGNGRVATFSSQEQGDGGIAFYCGYGIGGAQSLAGYVAIESPTAPQITGLLRWTVPAGVDARMPAGVDADYDTVGARYKAGAVSSLLTLDPSKQIALGLEIPTLTPSKKNYTFPMTANVISFVTTRPYSQLRFFPATGMFSGATPFDYVQRNFYGVLLQGEELNYGVGYLQDTNALGTVSIQPESLR